VVDAMAKVAHKNGDQVSTSSVGPTWGGQITNRAIEALIVFFIAVVSYISVRFEPKMAGAAFAAMVHDLLVTVGVFSLMGFQITPDTVIAILTILGYSLYDTVVVFDRVRDNTGGVLKAGDMTYSDMVNLSMNQTLARSINTSLVAILPVLSVLIVGAYILGATTLQNYGLALCVGLFSGAYSSIFIASPLLAIMKEREPRFRDLAARVGQRADRAALSPAAAARMSGEGAQRTVGSTRSATATMVKPRARKQKRR
jgi:preprotein translocase subunit SecF